MFPKPQSNTTDTFTPSEIAFLYVFRSLWSNLKNLSKCLKSRILTNRSDVVQLLSLYASAFLQILLLRLFPALLLLYFLSVPVTVTQKKSGLLQVLRSMLPRHCHYNSKHTLHHTLNSHNRFSSLKHVLFFLCFTIQYRCKNQCPK